MDFFFSFFLWSSWFWQEYRAYYNFPWSSTLMCSLYLVEGVQKWVISSGFFIFTFCVVGDSPPGLSKEITSALSGVPGFEVDSFSCDDPLRMDPLALEGLGMLTDGDLLLPDPAVEDSFRSDRLKWGDVLGVVGAPRPGRAERATHESRRADYKDGREVGQKRSVPPPLGAWRRPAVKTPLPLMGILLLSLLERMGEGGKKNFKRFKNGTNTFQWMVQLFIFPVLFCYMQALRGSHSCDDNANLGISLYGSYLHVNKCTSENATKRHQCMWDISLLWKEKKKQSQLNLKTCHRKNIHYNLDRDMLEMSSSFLFSSHKTRPRIIQPLSILFLIKSKGLLGSWVKSLIVTCASLKDRSSAMAPDLFKSVTCLKGSVEPHCSTAVAVTICLQFERSMYPSIDAGMSQIQTVVNPVWEQSLCARPRCH